MPDDSSYRKILQKTFSDIDVGKAAVVIGPGILEAEGIPIEQSIRRQIEHSFQDKIAAYYERDGVFVFSNRSYRNYIAWDVAEIYKNSTPNESILQKIIEIPFPLIISVNPDTFLSDYAWRLGIPHNFSSFNPRRPSKSVEQPTNNVPLFYNIAGCVREEESLIIDYDDLFTLIQGLLSSSSLPDGLTAKVREIRSFLFIGFRFDRWYTQLLLKLLNIQNGEMSLALKSGLSNDDEGNTQTFLLRQFNVEFIDDFNLLDSVYALCKEAGTLRKSKQNFEEEENEIISLLQKGEIEEAKDKLLLATKNTPLFDEAIILASRLEELNKNKNTIDSRDFYTQRAQIVQALLTMVKQTPSNQHINSIQ